MRSAMTLARSGASEFPREWQPGLRSQLVGLVCGLGAGLIWGAWPVVSKMAVRDSLSPLDIAAIRYAVAGMLLLPVFVRGVRKVRNWRLACLMAFGAGAPYVLLGIGGLQWQSVSHASILAPCFSVSGSALGASYFAGERLSRRRAAGLVLLLAGVMLVTSDGWSRAGFRSDAWIGDLMFAGSGALWATFTVAARKASLPALNGAAIVSVLSACAFLPVYLGIYPHRLLELPTAIVASQALFQGVIVAIVALVLHTVAIARLGAGRAGLFPSLVPAVAVILSWLALGESPSALTMAGLAVVTAGMWLALSLKAARCTSTTSSPA